MSEYRHDLVTGQWVIVASNRGERPDEFVETVFERINQDCPFCSGREDDTPPEVARYQLRRTKGWQVRVVPNKYPAVTTSAPPPPPTLSLPAQSGFGVHEVVIESPEHVTSLTELSAEATTLVFRAYADRLAALRKRGDLAYGVVFKNVGASAGASLEHVHSQVLATALVPPPIEQRLARWQQEFQRTDSSVLLRFIQEELAQPQRVIQQTDNFAAVCPFASRVPYEMRIVPLAPRVYFEQSTAAELDELAKLVRDVLTRLEQITNRMAYNLIIHTAPFDSAPHDYYHWHIEILPRLTRAAGFEWGTGCFINPLTPENAAQRLRDA